MMHPILRVPPTRPAYWQARCDQEVRRAELQAAIELRRLEEEQKLLKVEVDRIAAELERCGESESGVRAHRILARWWGGLCAVALALAIMSAWWSVNWYLTLTWEKAVLATALCVLPLIGWMAFLMRGRKILPERSVQKTLCALGLLIVLSSIAAGTLLGLGRMAGTALSEERVAAGTAPAGDLDGALSTPTTDRAAWVKKLLSIVTAGAVILLIVASEVASGLAFDDYVKRMTVVWTVAPLYRRRDEVGALLAANAEAQEAERRRPDLLRTQLTIAGLTQEETRLERVADEQRRAEAEARAAEERARERDSMPFLIRRVCLAFLIGLIVILAIVALAAAAEAPGATVVLLDLSRSTAAGEYAKNLRAIEGVIVRLVALGEDFTVLGIGEGSFAGPTLMRESAPQSAGRFGEYLDGWRAAAVSRWRRTATALSPGASQSDIFGALARASEELNGTRGPRRLIVLSDMRHVGRGFNLEQVSGAPLVAASRASERSLVPRLDGVAVWALGVHTTGLDERHWRWLKTFWVEYLRRAGAELKAFSPNRHMSE